MLVVSDVYKSTYCEYIVEKLVNEKNMSDEKDTTFGGDTTLGLQGYK